MDAEYTKVVKYVEKYHMIEAGDVVAAGVSGGADSVCLLHMLHRLSRRIPFRLLAVHVDHGIRPESPQDAAFVEELCAAWGIPFRLRSVDLTAYAGERGLSEEEAGRQFRYEAFREALRGQQGNRSGKIAVAHNAGDRAETMLFHLFRGSGLRGLCAIRPVREDVIRPLLCLERREIEAYLAAEKLTYRTDSTNETDAYTRNRIRHHILPYAEREICAGAVAHMGELADIVEETERYLQKQTDILTERYVRQEEMPSGGTCLAVRWKELSAEDAVMYKRVLLLCLERLTPYRKDISGRHLEELLKLLRTQGSGQASLPCGIRAYKEYDRLFLYRMAGADNDGCRAGAASFSASEQAAGSSAGAEEATDSSVVYSVEPPATIDVGGGQVFCFTLEENSGDFWKNGKNIAQNRYTKWFDYDKITGALVLRTRRPGDVLTIDGALHTKTVQRYMIDEKIPAAWRDRMYLPADGQHILWVPGYRTSRRYCVEESTKRILQIQLRGGYHGGEN